MEVVETAGLIQKISEAGVLAAFMMLVIIGLSYALRMLWSRLNEYTDKHIQASEKTAEAMNGLTNVIERVISK